MIAYIEGKIAYKNPAYVIIETAGIGYQVHISLYTWPHIQDLDQCRLWTYLHIKEDAHTLYGFFEAEEKELFAKLISVSGIGPNTGRMILSSLSPVELKDAILTENVPVIQAVKGIGPKSAKRLILELKDKVSKDVGASGEITAKSPANQHNTMKEEALSALTMLGFSRNASEKAIANVLTSKKKIDSVEELIKLALQNT